MSAWHVWLMYSRDENVFKILALFTYDYENICMNRLFGIHMIGKYMYVVVFCLHISV